MAYGTKDLVVAIFVDGAQAKEQMLVALPEASRVFTLKFGEDANKRIASMMRERAELTALAGEYAVAMRTEVAGSESATAAAVLHADALRRLGITSVSTGTMLERMSQKAMVAGRTMSMYMTAPIVLAVAESAKLAINFQKNMELIHTQAGAPQSEVTAQSANILKYAQSGGSPQGPTELSQGLYHLESLGLRGTNALNALKTASQGAGMGMASLEDVATALGGAIVTGIKGVQDYNTAMGTISATVGAGNMRLQDYTSALSTGVLPTAKKAGLSLQEFGAALAVLTDRGMGAQMAATRLKMNIAMMIDPTTAAKHALADLGIGADQMANLSQKPGGFLKILELLSASMDDMRKKTGNNTRGLQDFMDAFGKGRSSSGMLTLVDSLSSGISSFQGKLTLIEAEQYGFTQRVAAYHQTAQYKISSAWASIQASMIQVGRGMMPVIVAVAGALKSLAQWFSGLSPAWRQVIGSAAIFLAALGPVLFMVGKVIQTVIYLGSVAKTTASIFTRVFTTVTAALGFTDAAAVKTGTSVESVGAAGTIASEEVTSATTVMDADLEGVVTNADLAAESVQNIGISARLMAAEAADPIIEVDTGLESITASAFTAAGAVDSIGASLTALPAAGVRAAGALTGLVTAAGAAIIGGTFGYAAYKFYESQVGGTPSKASIFKKSTPLAGSGTRDFWNAITKSLPDVPYIQAEDLTNALGNRKSSIKSISAENNGGKGPLVYKLTDGTGQVTYATTDGSGHFSFSDVNPAAAMMAAHASDKLNINAAKRYGVPKYMFLTERGKNLPPAPGVVPRGDTTGGTVSADAQARTMANLYTKYHDWGLALVAYAGGENVVNSFLAGKTPLPSALIKYAESVTGQQMPTGLFGTDRGSGAITAKNNPFIGQENAALQAAEDALKVGAGLKLLTPAQQAAFLQGQGDSTTTAGKQAQIRADETALEQLRKKFGLNTKNVAVLKEEDALTKQIASVTKQLTSEQARTAKAAAIKSADIAADKLFGLPINGGSSSTRAYEEAVRARLGKITKVTQEWGVNLSKAAKEGIAKINQELAGNPIDIPTEARTHIDQQLKQIQDTITGRVNTITEGIKKQGAALKAQADQIFSNLFTSANNALAAADKKALDTLQVAVQGSGFKSFLYQAYNDAGVKNLTPAETALKKLQDTHAKTSDTLQLIKDEGAGDFIAVQNDLYNLKVDSLQKQATAERKAADAAVKEGQTKLKDKQKTEKQVFDTEIKTLTKQLETKQITTEQYYKKLNTLLTNQGIDSHKLAIGTGKGLVDGITPGINKAIDLWNQYARAMNRAIVGKTSAHVGMLSPLSGGNAIKTLPGMHSGQASRQLQGMHAGTTDVHIHFHGPVIGTGLAQAGKELAPHVRNAIVRNQRVNINSGIY